MISDFTLVRVLGPEVYYPPQCTALGAILDVEIDVIRGNNGASEIKRFYKSYVSVIMKCYILRF